MRWSILILAAGALVTEAQLTDPDTETARRPPPSCCGRNEHFEQNSNSCQITCDNMHLEAIMGACAPRSECYCNKGYVRDKNGICIKRKYCPTTPPKCPKGEAWSDCGSSCPKSCDNRDNTCLMCTMNCVPGCYCTGTTIRGPNGTCVEPKNCPKRKCTGANEFFDPCPPTCPRTEKCENLWSKIPCTPVDCCEPQCRCKSGYFRNDQNECVSAKECSEPIQCGPNEVTTDCYNDCQKTCKNRFKNDRVCPLVCKGPGCVCKPDYLRHDNGTCVPEYECSPAECGEGEVYNECGSSCPPSCDNKGNTCLVCTEQCVPGCYCAEGTIRAQDNTCVKPDDCPPVICSPYEIFNECPPTCPPSDGCSNLWSKFNCTNAIKCCKPQCRCKLGYLRKGGICVPSKQCLS